MGKIKSEITKLFDECQRKYEEGGVAAVIEFIEEAIRQGDNLFSSLALLVQYERCEACDADMPSLNHICLICGQETKISKQQLVDAVIEDLKKGFALGDYTVLDELLNKLQIKTLVQSLPEEKWNEYKELNNSYFEIMHFDYYDEAGYEEIQIHCGEHGNVYLKQDGDKLGFIIDVYGQNDVLDTMTVWEEDLKDWDEEESGDPRNFSDVEIQEFKENWGQSHGEITSELGFPLSHAKSDELIIATGNYFWIEADKKWYNKHASMFTEREQAIADFLRS